MKLWVVTGYIHDELEYIVGVFDSLEKAEKAIEEYENEEKWGYCGLNTVELNSTDWDRVP